MQIVVSGASGWLGRATISACNQYLNQNYNLSLFASHERDIHIKGLGNFGVRELTYDFSQIVKFPELYVHLPFKTKDFQQSMSAESYIYLNRSLISQGVSFITNQKPRSVIIVSSGVVSRNIISNGLIDNDLYTALKIEEENLFREACDTVGANLVVMRLWGASGSEMTQPFKYAIGDLIKQALTSNEIKIYSSKLVYRRYVDAMQAMAVCVLAALAKKNIVFESGGTVMELDALARIIKEELNQTSSIFRTTVLGQIPDFYFSTDTTFETLASEFGIELMSIAEQVNRTATVVREQL